MYTHKQQFWGFTLLGCNLEPHLSFMMLLNLLPKLRRVPMEVKRASTLVGTLMRAFCFPVTRPARLPVVGQGATRLKDK